MGCLMWYLSFDRVMGLYSCIAQVLFELLKCLNDYDDFICVYWIDGHYA